MVLKPVEYSMNAFKMITVQDNFESSRMYQIVNAILNWVRRQLSCVKIFHAHIFTIHSILAIFSSNYENVILNSFSYKYNKLSPFVICGINVVDTISNFYTFCTHTQRENAAIFPRRYSFAIFFPVG